MYGQGGAGGASTSGGQGQGTGNPGTNAVGMGLQAKQIELQQKNVESQIALNMATASKTEAEAKKIAGVDSKNVEANTENLIQATNNEKIRRGLILANIRYQDAMEELTRNQADAKKLEFGQIKQGTKNLEKAWEQIDANIESINLDNSVKRQTIETMVQQAQANLQKTMAEIVTEKMRGKLSATQIMDYTSQINTRAEQMAQAWRRVKIEGGNYELNKAKFEVRDDGRGINKAKVYAKALERGIISKDEELSDSQIYGLIMQPGFSTADTISDISGRGVGLDVVKTGIEAVRGKIDIQSEEGKGTTFSIVLPLTLAIIDGMLVRSQEKIFIIPTLCITESFRPEPSHVHAAGGKDEFVQLRSDLLPIVRLSKVLELDDTMPNPWECTLVCIENVRGKFALLVDELVGRQQVVIKNCKTNNNTFTR